MPAKKKIKDILNIFEGQDHTLSMFFITRHLKEGVKKSDKVVDKYSFLANNVDLSPDVSNFFKTNVKKQLIKVENIDGYQLEAYNVISEDLGDKLYTYALNNAISFSNVITEQLVQNKTKYIDSLKSIKGNLWAYCIKISNDQGSAYLFRKTSSGKITATDEARNNLEKISSFFDSDEAELKVVKNETISFDDKVDCIYFNDEFLILRKSGFEQIVGLEEEFKSTANQVLDVIKKTELVTGIDLITSELDKSRALLKTLASIGRKQSHESFDINEIQKMKETLKKFEGKDLKVTDDGKLLLEDRHDVNYFVKLLNDYYKVGVITGKYYGTNAGNVITPP